MPRHTAVLGVERENVQARLGGAAAAGDNDMVAQYERAGKTAAGQGDGPLEAIVLQGGGEVLSVDTPLPCGPRNWFQSSE